MIAAGRYASALMGLANEKNKLDAVRNDMQTVKKVYDENHEFMLFIKSPVIKTDKKLSVIESIFKGKVEDITLSFLKLITSKRRESYIREIAVAFDEQYKTDKNIFTAVVTSARGLDKQTREKVLDLVKTQLKGEVDLVEKVDESTIGGFILKIGDKQIDKSVSRQLSNLKKELNKN